jgi:hypothetical protein
MPDMEAIRRGLAGNLRTEISATRVPQVSPWRKDNPSTPSLQVSGFDTITPETFGAPDEGIAIPMLIHCFVSSTLDRSSQANLDDLVFDVWAAILSDKQLTSRLLDNGTVQTGQDPAVDDLDVTACDGSQILTMPNGSEVLGSTFHVLLQL